LCEDERRIKRQEDTRDGDKEDQKRRDENTKKTIKKQRFVLRKEKKNPTD